MHYTYTNVYHIRNTYQRYHMSRNSEDYATQFYMHLHDISLRWRHNEHDSVSNYEPHDCLPNRLFRCNSKQASKLRVTGLCVGDSPVTGEFPAQMTNNTENVSIWWRHHDECQSVSEAILNTLDRSRIYV